MSETIKHTVGYWEHTPQGGARLIQKEVEVYTPDAQNRRRRQASRLKQRLDRATVWAQAEGILDGLTLTLEKGLQLAGMTPGFTLGSGGIDIDPRAVTALMEAATHASRILREKYMGGASFTELGEEIQDLLATRVGGGVDARQSLRLRRRGQRLRRSLL